MRANVHYAEGLALRQELGDRRGSATGLSNLAAAAQGQNDYTRAETLYRQSLVLHQSVKYMMGIVVCLAGLAGVAASQGHRERAVRLAGAADRVLQAAGIHLDQFGQGYYDRSIAAARALLSDDAFAAAYAAGQAMPLDEAIAEALDQ